MSNTEATADRDVTRTGTFLVVVYDSYDDPRFVPLDGAVQQVDDLAAALSPFGYEATVLANPDQDDVTGELRRWAGTWKADGRHGPAVVAWSGHAEVTGLGQLQLITRATENLADADDYFTAERLANRTLNSGADQILVLLDTCHAGAGAPAALQEALTVMARRTLPEPRRAWLGILAACQAHERAEGARGLLLETVLRLLRHGPARGAHGSVGRYRHEWSVRNKGISGETLALAVMEEWPDSGQIPVRASAGRPERIFRNPLYRSDAGEALVEHLVLAARGIDPTEEGWFFTGRRRVMREITDWLAERQAGLLLLTGSAGSGKSAVAGRVAALSHPKERQVTLYHAPLADDEPDPGPDCVDAALHLRGMRVQDVAEALAEKLGLPAPETPAGLIAELEGLEAGGAGRHVLVLDGLDEAAPEQAGPIAEQLLTPLSRLCTVLLASRDRPFQPHAEPGETLDAALTQAIKATVRVVDLDGEPDTAEDIAAYVRKRLLSDAVPEHTVDDIASVLAERAVGSRGGFLFARIVASALARHLASDAGRPWQELIPDGITDALARDLASGAVLQRDGRALPRAAGDLLTALAWSEGNGMPAQGVWETAAGAVSRQGTVYWPQDIDWVLGHYGRYIVEDSDGEQAVYRLYHRELIAHLISFDARQQSVDDGVSAAVSIVRAFVDLVLRQTGGGSRPEEANAYLRRHLDDHAMFAGEAGIAALRGLVDINPRAYLPLLGTALGSLATLLGEAGLQQRAMGPAEEAVAVYRRLTKDDPATYRVGLARSLNNFAVQLSTTGRRQDAVAPAEEAVRIQRELAAGNPVAYLSDLASSLNTLAVLLSDIGRRDEAMAPAEEAVRIQRSLAEVNPTAYRPRLASALNNLGNRQWEVGQRREAMAPTEEAVRIRRRLAADNPAAHLSDLATSLSNFAIQLALLGRRQEALTPAGEAVRLHRRLAAENRAAYLPDLATSLHNFANRLAGAGQRQEALAPAEEAVRIRRELADDNPAAYLPNLAGALGGLANRQADTGRHEEALVSSGEAVRIYRLLTDRNAAAYLPSLASALNNFAIHTMRAGQLRASVALAEESVRIRRLLADDNPAAHRPDLASSLHNLAVQLAEAGRHHEATELSEEAVGIYRELTRTDRASYLPDMAAALSNLAIQLARSQRHDEAIGLAEEAVGIHRELADTNQPAHLANMAAALHALAVELVETGRRREALAPAEEALRICQELIRTGPAAHLDRLTNALRNLAVCLTDEGRKAEAVRVHQEVIGACRNEQPQVAARISCELAAFHLMYGSPDDSADILCTVLTPPVTADSATVLQAHRLLHDVVNAHPAQRATVAHRCGEDGKAPAWLDIGKESLELTASWINTPTWTDSRAFLLAHPGLRSDESVLALREWALVNRDAERHADLLAQIARGTGVDDVYRPLILRETVTAWVTSGDPAASAQYLTTHAADLLAPDTDPLLAEMADDDAAGLAFEVHRALLALAATDGVEAAYALLQDPQAFQSRIRTALDSADAHSLAWLSVIEDVLFEAPWSAALHRLTARALAGAEDTDGAQVPMRLDGEPTPEERTRAASELAALIALRPDRATELSAVLQAALR